MDQPERVRDPTRPATLSSARSYVHATSPKALLGLTVGDVLDSAARQWPDGQALVVPHQGVRWSWDELRQKATRCAAGLLALGLEPGDRVGVLAPNLSEWIVTQFGTAYAGLILVNINPAYRLPELEYALRKTGCRALITAARFKSSDYVGMLHELIPELGRHTFGHLQSERLPELRFPIRLGTERTPGLACFDELAERVTADDERRRVAISSRLDFDDPINIQFTSGTTGTPKAATLTHHNIVNNAWISADVMRLSPVDRLCIPVPMYHCFGMVLGTLLCATHGATMVLPSAGFDARAVLEAVNAERCTALHGVPTMFIAELDVPGFAEYDLSSLRTGIMAGAPCPIALMRRVMDEMHLAEITIGYGMTETGPLSTQTSVGDPVELRVSTVGRVLPHTEVKIIDKSGCMVPRGTPGELCTRGYCVMRGYWDDAGRIAEAVDAAHWIQSGDIATMDEDGFVRIVGRIKDMIIRGGENIYPREVETCLYGCDKIEEVEVFGVPDEKYGEQVTAWIKLRAGASADADEIRAFCEGRLAHFKVPRFVKFVEEFPLTVTGKAQKYIMRERMARELGLVKESST